MITLLTSKEFEEKYPKWYEPNYELEYRNLPQECFIIRKNDRFVVIDNADLNCYIDNFTSLNDAIEYYGNDEVLVHSESITEKEILCYLSMSKR